MQGRRTSLAWWRVLWLSLFSLIEVVVSVPPLALHQVRSGFIDIPKYPGTFNPAVFYLGPQYARPFLVTFRLPLRPDSLGSHRIRRSALGLCRTDDPLRCTDPIVLPIAAPEGAVLARLSDPNNRFCHYDSFVGATDLRMLPVGNGRFLALFGMNSGVPSISRIMWRATLTSIGNATSLVEGSMQELRYPKAAPVEKNWVPFPSLRGQWYLSYGLSPHSVLAVAEDGRCSDIATTPSPCLASAFPPCPPPEGRPCHGIPVGPPMPRGCRDFHHNTNGVLLRMCAQRACRGDEPVVVLALMHTVPHRLNHYAVMWQLAPPFRLLNMTAVVLPPLPTLRLYFATSLSFLAPGIGHLDSALMVGGGVNDRKSHLWVTTPADLLRTSAPCL